MMMQILRGRNLALSLLLLALSACASAVPPATLTVIAPTTAATPSQIASQSAPAACPSRPAPSGEVSDFLPGGALPKVVAASTAIVIGSAQPSAEIVNMAFGDSFGVGQVYTISVQRYLKGSGPDTIKVVQSEGFINKPTACVTAQDIALARSLYAKDYIRMQVDTDYLLLLTPASLPGPATDYWMGTDRRWRWRLQPDGLGVLEVIGYTIQTEPNPTWSDSQPIAPQIEALIHATQ